MSARTRKTGTDLFSGPENKSVPVSGTATTHVLLTGFGGQGVVLAGHILGKAAAILDGREATLIQAYGPEARGGATSAEIVISSAPILYPYVHEADVLVAMSQEGFTKFIPTLRPGCPLIYDQQLVLLPEGFAAAPRYAVPFTRLAEAAGRKLVANIVMLGALVAVTGVVGRAALEETIRTSVPKGTEELNLGAFALGFDHAAALVAGRTPGP